MGNENAVEEALIDACADAIFENGCQQRASGALEACTTGQAPVCSRAACRAACASTGLPTDLTSPTAGPMKQVAVQCIRHVSKASTAACEDAFDATGGDWQQALASLSGQCVTQQQCTFNGRSYPTVFRDCYGNANSMGSNVGNGGKTPNSELNTNERDELLRLHNEKRARHCAPPLRWDGRLATQAQRYANTCPCGPSAASYRRGAAENLAWGFVSAHDVIESGWYAQIRDYNSFSNGGSASSGAVGQLRTMLWQASSKIGCGKAQCQQPASGVVVWVCHYQAAGNVPSTAAANVLAPQQSCFEALAPGPMLPKWRPRPQLRAAKAAAIRLRRRPRRRRRSAREHHHLDRED